MKNNINSYHLSRKGKKNIENEDCIVLPEINKKFNLSSINTNEKGFLYVVCDGMGGHQAGEVASELCSNWLEKDYYESPVTDDIPNWLNNKIKYLNNKLYKLSKEHKEYSGMGTTLVNLLIKDEFAYINNVGDSRLYLFDFDKDKFQQITEDHSEVWKLYEQKIISKEDIITHPRKNIITQAMGIDKNVKQNSYEIKLPKKYLFLLCSDGLTDVMIDDAIQNIIEESSNLEEITESLYNLSQENKSKDDVSIVVVSNFKL
ncbi:MAG: Stp1/IreP family PP2C-type Ser/Thr phosphatase [Candidatus Marinimicrobia bacterium]|nr:Stp1/IreP family PP2C-type Ser/Thr phosphatase [Candidatus Neomarinimicrobiota bacterium]